MAEPEHLIRIFLALNRGSRSELGFDPTITCVGFYPAVGHVSEGRSRESKERQYEFEVHDNHDDPRDDSPNRKRTKKYRGVRCIANYGMIGIHDRGTSIYSVRESDNEDAPLQVLKDSWIDVDRVIEGRVLEDIHTTLYSDLEYRPYRRHLLKPDYYGFVPNDAGVRMETISCSRFANEPSSWHSIVLNGGNAGCRADARKRCRIVFVEGPGTELWDLEALGKVFTAIKGGLNGPAMLAMYRAGYIHRDLSTGNIILLSRESNQSERNEDVGVLTDLEYAKKFPDGATRSGDTRTGTWEFVASEVRVGWYAYSRRGGREDEIVPWFRHPVHDVESCWWIACWSFFHFKHPKLLPEHMIDRNYLFSPLQLPLGTVDTPLGCIPKDLRSDLEALADSIGEAYRKLQLGRGDKEKLDSFDYEPIIRTAIRHVESMIRVSMEKYSTSWSLSPRQPDVDTRPTREIKTEEPSSSDA